MVYDVCPPKVVQREALRPLDEMRLGWRARRASEYGNDHRAEENKLSFKSEELGSCGQLFINLVHWLPKPHERMRKFQKEQFVMVRGFMRFQH